MVDNFLPVLYLPKLRVFLYKKDKIFLIVGQSVDLTKMLPNSVGE